MAEPLDAAGRDRGSDFVLWIIAFASAGPTVALSFVGEPPGSQIVGLDKVEHAVAYFMTTVVVLLAGVWRPGRGAGPWWRFRRWVAGGILIAGALIEVLQATVMTHRNGDVRDWFAGAAGVTLAVATVAALRRRERAQRSLVDRPERC
jgi:hypothetical protein